jgi:hypothetical protein
MQFNDTAVIERPTRKRMTLGQAKYKGAKAHTLNLPLNPNVPRDSLCGLWWQ